MVESGAVPLSIILILEGKFGSLGYKSHKSCKILPNFLPTLHFLQESYKYVQESQILQSCYDVEHFLQCRKDSDRISSKLAFSRKKFLQKMRCVILTKNSFKTVTFVQFCVLLNNICFNGLVLKVISNRVTLTTRVVCCF